MKWLLAVGALVLALVVIVVFFWPGRTSGPERIVYGRDACARCRMQISTPGLGGELRDQDGVRKYDDVGCLLGDLATAPGAAAWVEDHAGSGFVPVERAVYVRGGKIQTPMASGIVAFREEAAARELAGTMGAALVPWTALQAAGAPGAPAAGAPPATLAPLAESDARKGKAVFVQECSACHGERGDGEGPAAAFLDPRPRNFRKAVFKLRSTESGQPPRHADVLGTIERGIPGSAMPSFSFLTPDQRRQVAAYVLHTADLLDRPQPAAIPDPGTPPPPTPESVARGKAIYAQMKCASCHGEQGRGDGASELKDDQGRPIAVRDFTGGEFRGGGEPRDLYLRFVTGMDGSPMPSFADSVSGADRWALVDFVLSLQVPREPEPLPADPITAGRVVTTRYGCRGCHVLDDGKGGAVGPDLRVAGVKLDPTWVRQFLPDPRAEGKIYPWRPWRMPHLGVTAAEADVLARYVAAMGHKEDKPHTLPDPAQFPPARLEEGKNFYMLRCSQCHALGKVVETPLATQQGPDLIRVAARIDYFWVKDWVLDPKKVDPTSKMANPELTPDQVDAVRMFVWKHSMDAARPRGGAD